MCKEVLITGVKVTTQMKRADKILKTVVIPQEKQFQQRKKNGTLSPELKKALKGNA